jgi:hypothetical protein
LPSLISERGFAGAASIRFNRRVAALVRRLGERGLRAEGDVWRSSAFEVQADGGNFGKLSEEDDGA